MFGIDTRRIYTEEIFSSSCYISHVRRTNLFIYYVFRVLTRDNKTSELLRCRTNLSSEWCSRGAGFEWLDVGSITWNNEINPFFYNVQGGLALFSRRLWKILQFFTFVPADLYAGQWEVSTAGGSALGQERSSEGLAPRRLFDVSELVVATGIF